MRKDGCLICQIIEGKIPSVKIYEDDSTLAILDLNGASKGHAFVIPKAHYAILEHVPNEELGKLFIAANKVSVALFEGVGAEGTNILLANGIPAGQTVAHMMLNVIPRRQNDGIDLSWKPRQIDEEMMSTVELKIKEKLGSGAIEQKKAPSQRKKPQAREEAFGSFEELQDVERQIRRMP